MSVDSNKNISLATTVDSTLQAKKRVRYVLPKGCVIGGSYCIEKPLGHGGMGEVYLARHMKLDIYRAIKILLPKIAVKNPVFATRFMREAKLAIQLQHPNIINVMDAEYDERLSIYYIVMEYVDGGNIRNLIRKNGPLDEQDVLNIVLHVGEALAVGEERKIVHRDIKPDNIMLTKDKVVKLADLGIAKSTADKNEVDVTSPEILIGTPAYVSPEQARDAQHVDSRADIYSLGVSMYEMLTGEKPYKGKTTVEILQQLFEAPVPDVRQKNSAVSKKVSNLVFRMMAKEKEKRPRNWKIFCKEVSRLLEGYESNSSSDTVTTVSENINDFLPRKVILDSEEKRLNIDKKKVRKIVKYASFAVLGFALCYLFLSGLLSKNNLIAARDSAVMFLIGKEFRLQCRKYKLTPPMFLVISSGALKQAWIDQNKPAPEYPPPPQPDPIPVVVKQTVKVKFDITADDALKQWWKKNNHKMKVRIDSQPEKSFALPEPDEIELECGNRSLKIEIPGIKTPISYSNIEIKNGQPPFSICVEPVDATLKIVCDVSDITLTVNGNLSGKDKEIKVPPFRNQEIVAKAEGYKWKKQIINGDELLPGGNKTVKFYMEKLPPVPPLSKKILEADKYFKEGCEAEEKASKVKYAKALKIYMEETHPHAFYRRGLIVRDGLAGPYFKGDWKDYFARAAEGRHLEGMYEYGKIQQDDAKYRNALIWYRQCAEQNYLPALVKLGDFYKDGKREYDEKIQNEIEVVKRDENTALQYYEQVVHLYDQKDKKDRALKNACREALAKIINIYEEKYRDARTDKEKSEYFGKVNKYKDKEQKLAKN